MGLLDRLAVEDTHPLDLGEDSHPEVEVDSSYSQMNQIWIKLIFLFGLSEDKSSAKKLVSLPHMYAK